LQIIDISNPAAPTFAGTYDPQCDRRSLWKPTIDLCTIK
jgi:hypothetical protein